MAISHRLELQNPDGARCSAKQFLLQLAADLEMTALPLEFDDLEDVENLPPHHKDPFDPVLVVQACRHGPTLVGVNAWSHCLQRSLCACPSSTCRQNVAKPKAGDNSSFLRLIVNAKTYMRRLCSA